MTLRLDEVGSWTEAKLALISGYASAYARIVSKAPYIKRVYVDGFAGPGQHVSETSGFVIQGTPLRILEVSPAFEEYHFVEADPDRVKELRRQIGSRPGVKIYQGDCSEILASKVLPGLTREGYRKGLCFLDPYGLHLDWGVMIMLAQLGTMDMVLNFPIFDMNRNALQHHPENVSPGNRARMTRFWGDESWRADLYEDQGGLFCGAETAIKKPNEAVVEAFRQRLLHVAGFAHVSKALAMKNEQGAPIYYLVGASNHRLGTKVLNDMFRAEETRRAFRG